MSTFQKFAALELGPLQIQIWGLLVAVGMLLALLFSIREARRRKLDSEYFIDIFIIVFLSSIIGSRLLYVLEHFGEFSQNPMSAFYVQQGGLVLYGAFILATLAMIVYTKFKKIAFLKVSDVIVTGLALAIAVGRIGSYMIGDHIGSRTDFFLGSYFNGDLRHEPSLYLSVSAFLLFFLLYLLKPFIKKEGLLSYIFVVWYSVSRFLIDFTRAADIEGLSDPLYAGLTLSQWISLVLFIIFTPLLLRKILQTKNK